MLEQLRDNVKYLVGDYNVLSASKTTPVLPMFSQQSVDFLSALSKEILKDKRAKGHVDVISYAYWIRKSSLEQAKSKYCDYQYRLGRGVAFHIAPSNVPVNFAVSMTSSILAGNISVIRVSNKEFMQVDIICEAINNLLQSEFQCMKPYFCIIRYDYSNEITDMLSLMCDIRIIWGGNNTIENIRKSPLPPRAIEMSFADRFSLAIINSDEYLKQDVESIAKGFYTDTYYTDQNACSSPRLVIWLGRSVEKAKKIFWNSLEILVKKDYDLKPIQAMDKYTMACMIGMNSNKQHIASENNYIVRLELDELKSDLTKYKGNSGYFYEYTANNLDEIVPILNKECQTVSVLGIETEDVWNIVAKYGVRGVDRIVLLGQTMGLEFVWDGYKMIEAMSRLVYVG